MKKIKDLKQFIIFWSTQSLSQLGSSMTSYALTLWLFEQTNSALETALLAICSYSPYVLMSIFAGSLSERWNYKKTILACDTCAALSTIVLLVMFKTNTLMPYHLYLLNSLSGLMNTFQNPASEVALTLIVPSEHYQKTSGMQSFSNSLITILNPVMATAIYGLMGMDAIIFVDLVTFMIAFITLLFYVKIPKVVFNSKKKDSILKSAKVGLSYLKSNPMILWLILFLAGVNFVASAFNATLPAFVLLNSNNQQVILGLVSTFAGIGNLIGSTIATFMKNPKNRIRVIYITMLFSLSTENFILAFTKTPILWCIAQLIGWCLVPIMSANLSVIFRSTIPIELQSRVYACRNTLQFFTIPLGRLWGGFMVDYICQPLMQKSNSKLLLYIFGSSSGAGAALMMFILGVMGSMFCLFFGKKLRQFQYND